MWMLMYHALWRSGNLMTVLRRADVYRYHEASALKWNNMTHCDGLFIIRI